MQFYSILLFLFLSLFVPFVLIYVKHIELSLCMNLSCLALPQETEYPLMVIGIFIQQPTPFVSVFFERLLKLKYPKNRLKLFIFNQVCLTSLI